MIRKVYFASLLVACFLLAAATVASAETTSIPLGFVVTGDIKILPNGEKAYLALDSENTVLVIDTDPKSPTYNSVITNVPVGADPHDIAIHPSEKLIYVTNEQSRDISVVSTSDDSVVASVSAGARVPNGIAITPDGTRAYYCSFDGYIMVLDTKPSSPTYHLVIDRIARPLLLSCNIAITQDGKKAAVIWQGTIALGLEIIDINPSSPTYHQIVGSPIPVISGSRGDVETSTDSRFVYATSTWESCRLCKVDLQTYQIVTNNDYYRFNIALSPDGSSLLLSDLNHTEVPQIDTSNLKYLGYIDLLYPLGDMAITPDGQRVYVVRRDLNSNEAEVLTFPFDSINLFNGEFPWELFLPAITHGSREK